MIGILLWGIGGLVLVVHGLVFNDEGSGTVGIIMVGFASTWMRIRESK